MEKEKKFLLIADLHGSFKPVRDLIDKYLTKEEIEKYDITLIVLGDAGLQYFFDYRDRNLKRKLKKYPFEYFIIRGNHEQRPSILKEQNSDLWHIEDYLGNKVYVENDYPYIKYALDEGGEYNINGKSVLILPGAYSPDKSYRLKRGWSWFPQEQLSEDEKTNILKNLKSHYDYIFAHTCPNSFEYYIQDLFLSVINQKEMDKSMEKWLDQVVKNTSYERFYFGHYHGNRNIEPFKASMVFHQPLWLGEKY